MPGHLVARVDFRADGPGRYARGWERRFSDDDGPQVAHVGGCGCWGRGASLGAGMVVPSLR